MKKKILKSKLVLNKERIANLSKIIGGGTRICDAAAEYALVQSPELGSGGPDETVDVSDVKGTCKG